MSPVIRYYSSAGLVSTIFTTWDTSIPLEHNNLEQSNELGNRLGN